MSALNFSLFVAAYIECAFFTDTGEGDQPPADGELAESARADATFDCGHFVDEARSLLEEAVTRVGYDSTRAGHDFWYTRNGHGVGYWGRDELSEDGLGDRLSEIAKRQGGASLYQGDDGLIYFAGG